MSQDKHTPGPREAEAIARALENMRRFPFSVTLSDRMGFWAAPRFATYAEAEAYIRTLPRGWNARVTK